MRITEKEMLALFSRCQGINPRLVMNFAYGKQQVRLKSLKGSGTECTLSGLLNKSEMIDWIDGFLAANQETIQIQPYHEEMPEGYTPGQMVPKFSTISTLVALGWNVAIINHILYVDSGRFTQR